MTNLYYLLNPKNLQDFITLFENGYKQFSHLFNSEDVTK